MCPSPSSALCPLLYRTEHFSGEKRANVPRKGEEEGWPEEKRTRENRSVLMGLFRGAVFRHGGGA